MITRLQLEIAAGVVVVIGGAVGFRSWLNEHDLRLHAETVATESAKAASEAKKASDAVQDRIDARDRAASDDRKTYLDQIAKMKTAATIVPYVQKEIAPTAPFPITVNIPPATKEDPTPDAIVKIPQADLAAVRDRFAKCDLDSKDLTTCQADGVDLKEKIRLAGVSLSETAKERDAYKQALNGGTFWRRAKTAAKFIGFGAAAAIAATCGSGHCR